MNRHLRNRCLVSTVLALFSHPAAVTAQGDRFLLRVDRPCMFELTLRTEDTLAVSSPSPDCGELRLIYEGPRTIVREQFKLFEIAFGLQNIGTRTLSTPIEVEVDSVTQVREGRQIASAFSWGFEEISSRRAAAGETIALGPSTEPAPPLEEGGTQSRLLPRQRTNTRMLRISVAPKARTLRIWIGFPRAPIGILATHRRSCGHARLPPRAR